MSFCKMVRQSTRRVTKSLKDRISQQKMLEFYLFIFVFISYFPTYKPHKRSSLFIETEKMKDNQQVKKHKT